MTAPRLDPDAFAAMNGRRSSRSSPTRAAIRKSVYGDTIAVTMSQHHFRSRPLTAATFAEVDPNKALQFYKDRLANAGTFTLPSSAM